MKISKLLKNPIFILSIVPLVLSILSLIYATGPRAGGWLFSTPEGRGWPFVIVEYKYYFPEGKGSLNEAEIYNYYNFTGISLLGFIANYVFYFILTGIGFLVFKLVSKFSK